MFLLISRLYNKGNHKIKVMSTAGNSVHELAGSGTAGLKDGKGSAAEFNMPMSIAAPVRRCRLTSG